MRSRAGGPQDNVVAAGIKRDSSALFAELSRSYSVDVTTLFRLEDVKLLPTSQLRESDATP